MSHVVRASLDAGKPYIFTLKDGSSKRITVWGSSDGVVDAEVDGVRSNYANLTEAIGGSCIGFTDADA